MLKHNRNNTKLKKNMFWLFILLTIHAYFFTVLLLLRELDNLTNKSNIKPFFGNGYRRKYETQLQS